MPVPRVLIVEDAYSLAESYRVCLRDTALIIDTAASNSEALTALNANMPDLVLLDVHLPDGSGLDILRELRKRGSRAEVIVSTGQASINLAVEAMRDGASDFLIKPFSVERLRATIDAALKRREFHYKHEQRQVERAEAQAPSFRTDQVAGASLPVSPPRKSGTQVADATADGLGRLIGQSEPMRAVFRMIRKAAPSTATVFVTGESGTGKELCADALHQLSKRRHGPFITMNCAAIPRDLLESEIFGHVKGAFTGASADRKGAVLQAHGGTLFLDEICEMDLGLQAKMLRFLQQKTVQRVGEDMTRPADVRIVCATNREPQAEVAAGRFREDLFYRLHVVPIEMPALRDRGDDILLIARHALREFAQEDGKSFTQLADETERALLDYAWPGNVRQLLNVIRNVIVLNDGPVVELTMLPRDIRQPVTGTVAPPLATPALVEWNFSAPDDTRVLPLETVIRITIETAIAACGGSIPRAAAALDVSPSTLYRRMQSWDQTDLVPGLGTAVSGS